jgi:hypothetical protein
MSLINTEEVFKNRRSMRIGKTHFLIAAITIFAIGACRRAPTAIAENFEAEVERYKASPHTDAGFQALLQKAGYHFLLHRQAYEARMLHCKPCAANFSATARPMPFVPPVTTMSLFIANSPKARYGRYSITGGFRCTRSEVMLAVAIVRPATPGSQSSSHLENVHLDWTTGDNDGRHFIGATST